MTTTDAFDTERDLIAAMVANVPSAWRQFQLRYDRLVLRCISSVTRRFTSRVSDDDVREIYASFYLALLSNDMHKLRSWDPSRGNRFSSWIGLLAINAAYDHLRTLRREPPKECIWDVEIADDMPDPFEVTSDNERARIATRALSEFSEKDRTFAVLYFAEALDPSVIARRLNISINTVYSKKHKIRSRLEGVLATRDAHAA